MNKQSTLLLCAVVMVLSLSSCEIAGGIFKAGFYSAIIAVVLVIIIIVWLVRKMRR